MILLSHPIGNSVFREAARAFYSNKLLGDLFSTICWNSSHKLSKLLPKSIFEKLNRRSFSDIPYELQHSHPIREVLRLLTVDIFIGILHQHEKGLLSYDSVYSSFDRNVAKALSHLVNINAVYAYEDAALHTFRASQSLGITCHYDLPIPYWRHLHSLLEEERELKPEWADTLFGLFDSPGKLLRKDEELSLADTVVVPSQFVANSLCLSTVKPDSIKVVPFGCPTPRIVSPIKRASGPLRVLYVGLLIQRKGISYALEAIDLLGDQVTLTMIGRSSARQCTPLNAALAKHRWIPSLPHQQILEQMAQHDVLLFPTLAEGFGLVITEALSQGLPIITTVNSGAPECMTDGVEGFIVPIRNSHSIANCLQRLVDDPQILFRMRTACLLKARELRWSQYGLNLIKAISPP